MSQGKDVANTNFDRRKFLKLAAAGTAALILGSEVVDSAMDIGLNTITDGMEESTPPEFSDILIPERNPNYLPPQSILAESFNIYRHWQTNDPSLPHLSFHHLSGYASDLSLISNIPKVFAPSQEGFIGHLSNVIYDSESTRKELFLESSCYRPFTEFSFSNLIEIVGYDVGAGLVTPTTNKFLQEYNLSKEDFYHLLYDENTSGLSDEQTEFLRANIVKSISQATSYFTKTRQESGKPLSLATSIAYFLYQNKGQIMPSLFDATLYAKLFVRNNLETLEPKSTYQQAFNYSQLFLDQFSPRTSLNWLVSEIESHGRPPYLLEDSPIATEQFKNFMPINIAGVSYHGLNLTALAAGCMSTPVLKKYSLAYYNARHLGYFDIRAQHGSNKVRADIQVVSNSDKIKETIRESIK